MSKKVGLALGGGFLRATAHIGVLKVLVEEHVPVDMIAGSSAGSLVAALFARGLSPGRIEREALSLRARDVFDSGLALANLFLMVGKSVADFFRFPFPFRVPLGLMKGRNLERLIERLVGKKGDWKIPLAVTSVDVSCGTLVVFREGQVVGNAAGRTVVPPEDMIFVSGFPITRAVRASCAVPGLFEPVVVEGMILVDGGVRDNVPAGVLKEMGADVVLAVDVGYDGYPCKKIKNMVDLLTRSLDIMTSEGSRVKLDLYADVVLRPPIDDVDPWDFEKIPYCIAQGEKFARRALPEIREALGGNC